MSTVAKGAIIIPYLRTENLKNHTLSRNTYLNSPFMGIPPEGDGGNDTARYPSVFLFVASEKKKRKLENSDKESKCKLFFCGIDTKR